jgi:hypothetical protein
MNALTTQVRSRPLSVFADAESFETGQRIAKALVSSDLVPVTYRGADKIGNAMIAMDMANRVGVSAMVVMQNLHIIEGRPSWSSQFIISALNSCGLFSPLRYKLEKLGEKEISFDAWEGPKGNRTKVVKKKKIQEMTCIAYAIEKDTGEVLEGPEVSISMAVAEGWYTKPGSKWVTMPDLMIRYRAAAFFGRLYAPDVMNGMSTQEEAMDMVEMRDVTPLQPEPVTTTDEAKPAGRPKGIHAAMAATPKEPKPKKPAKVIEADANESENNAGSVDDLQTRDGGEGDGGGEDGDMFGAPGEDDDDGYDPA